MAELVAKASSNFDGGNQEESEHQNMWKVS